MLRTAGDWVGAEAETSTLPNLSPSHAVIEVETEKNEVRADPASYSPRAKLGIIVALALAAWAVVLIPAWLVLTAI